MEKGEASRVAFAIGVLTDWVARTDERIAKLEAIANEGLQAGASAKFDDLVERVKQLEHNQEILRRFTPGL